MSDNTKQFRWIVTIEGGLERLYRDDPNVFVGGDLLWYPVEGHPEIRLAPDALVAFGRPKGDRGSYLQWLERGVPPQVVFEVLSPKNTAREMERKRQFYERYGAEEYYEFDPFRGRLRGWVRHGERLEPVTEMRGWISPRLGIRFDLQDGELVLQRPGGDRFLSYVDIATQRDEERQRAEQEHLRAQEEHLRAEQERRRAEQEHLRAERLAARLRAMGIDPDALAGDD